MLNTGGLKGFEPLKIDTDFNLNILKALKIDLSGYWEIKIGVRRTTIENPDLPLRAQRIVAQ